MQIQRKLQPTNKRNCVPCCCLAFDSMKTKNTQSCICISNLHLEHHHLRLRPWWSSSSQTIDKLDRVDSPIKLTSSWSPANFNSNIRVVHKSLVSSFELRFSNFECLNRLHSVQFISVQFCFVFELNDNFELANYFISRLQRSDERKKRRAKQNWFFVFFFLVSFLPSRICICCRLRCQKLLFPIRDDAIRVAEMQIIRRPIAMNRVAWMNERTNLWELAFELELRPMIANYSYFTELIDDSEYYNDAKIVKLTSKDCDYVICAILLIKIRTRPVAMRRDEQSWADKASESGHLCKTSEQSVQSDQQQQNNKGPRMFGWN